MNILLIIAIGIVFIAVLTYKHWSYKAYFEKKELEHEFRH